MLWRSSTVHNFQVSSRQQRAEGAITRSESAFKCFDIIFLSPYMLNFSVIIAFFKVLPWNNFFFMILVKIDLCVASSPCILSALNQRGKGVSFLILPTGVLKSENLTFHSGFKVQLNTSWKSCFCWPPEVLGVQLMIIFIIDWSADYFLSELFGQTKCQKIIKNVTVSQSLTWHIQSACFVLTNSPKLKNIQLSITEDYENQQIFTFEQLEWIFA